MSVSIEEFLAAVEAAEQRLAQGEAKAKEAKALLLQAEEARDEAAARQKEAEQRLAAVEAALEKARLLQALLGEETISQGEALLQQVRAEGEAEVARLQAEAEALQAKAEGLSVAPEVQAYLAFREAEEHKARETRERAQQELAARLATLRPGVAVGQGAEELERLAAEAEKAGFPDLAAQARDAAEAARRVAQAQAQAKAVLRKRRLARWAERRARQAQPGDFVYILEEPGDTLGLAVHLRPLPARRGRLRFQVVAAWQIEDAPGEYGDLPARGRVWRWRKVPDGELEGLTKAQAKLVAQIIRGKIRSGWAINKANARLARQAAEEREAAREAARQAANARVEAEAEPQVEDQAGSSVEAEAEAQAESETEIDDGLEGLPGRTQGRLRRVGLNTRQAITEMIAAGEAVFLALPGIGPATLAKVQAWLNGPVTEAEPEPQAEDQTEAGPRAESEPESPAEEQPQVEPEPVAADQFQVRISDPAIIVDASDDVPGQRLAGWRGAAVIGLTPVARQLGLEEVQILVSEEQGQATLIVVWPGGETTLSCPADGPAGQKRAIREIIAKIKGQHQHQQVQVSA